MKIHNPYCWPGTNCKIPPHTQDWFSNHFCEEENMKDYKRELDVIRSKELQDYLDSLSIEELTDLYRKSPEEQIEIVEKALGKKFAEEYDYDKTVV